MSRVFGRQPGPRLLVVGTENETEFRERLAQLAPTVRFVTEAECSEEVNHREWDAVVLWDCDAEISCEEVCALQFGGNQTSTLAHGRVRSSGYIRSPELSGTYIEPQEPVSDVSHLVEPLADVLVKAGTAQTMGLIPDFDFRQVVVPFLINSNDRPVAGIFRRRESGWEEWWWLPKSAPDPERWVAAALSRWRRLDPERFEPKVLDWTQDARWQTAEEQKLSHSVRELGAAHVEAVALYEHESRRLEDDLREAAKVANAGRRRLLTSQGSDLKDEVAAALTDLGFKVTDADAKLTKKGDLLEDLRVLDPDDTDWVALAEVRGYTGGAKVSDLLRIGRFVTRYTKAEGRFPSAAWYVVNQFINKDPGSRAAPLASNPEELAAFAEGGGAVLDTCVLFRLREAVRRGDTDAESARARLKQTGLLDL